ncbi:hypothetical protein [Marinoscillum sp. MHG1-6]|uniref:hypothetical protein n=1 Tax=Marinoscillum sp. MHG1-6 TaxID=2959627 RepID=UPI0021575055|nr:hypothetical protein [Marinoscillum sp. MHG1-6]
MTQDYQLLLENLHGRRFDEARRESIFSDSYEDTNYGDSIKYCLEAMHEIDPSYSYKSFAVAKRVQDKISVALANSGKKADFRYRGPIQTETHILLYGGIELMVIQEAMTRKPWEEVKSLTEEIMHTLTEHSVYKKVDYSDKYHIKITTTKPTCEIDIVPAIWLNNKDYVESRREIDRGVVEYNFLEKTQRKHLPFKNIARINAKDRKTNGGYKNLVRLLNTLQRDINPSINLQNFELCCLLYPIPDKQLIHDSKKALSLLGIASAQLKRAVNDPKYVENLLSPSEKERVFGTKKGKKDDIAKLKKLLDDLIADIKSELKPENKNLYSEIAY